MNLNVRHYCTLFDSRFLTRGMAMYRSLEKNSSSPFLLYVLAMDEESCQALNVMKCKNIKVIHFESEFLNEDLVSAKLNRPWVEFCWTCSSALMRYVLSEFNLKQVTYLDADIYFFDDPEQIFVKFDESKTTLITEHYYHPKHDQSSSSGVFCVQFVAINNNSEGRRLLEDWYQKCLLDCSTDTSRGTFGDQKYLDAWPNNFPNVIISNNRGAGLAPWNIERFDIIDRSGKLIVIESDRHYNAIFYHFHGLKIYAAGLMLLSGDRYKICRRVFERFYIPYFQAIEKEKKFFQNLGFEFHHALYSGMPKGKPFIAKLKSMIDGNWNRVKFWPYLI